MREPRQFSLEFAGESASSPPIARKTAPEQAVGAARNAVVYELRRGPRRHSLSIEVHPDLRVVVRAPLRLPQHEIEDFVAARARWISAQIEYFRQQPRAPLQPFYGHGTTHYYLGLPHRLLLDPAGADGIERHDDRLVIGGAAARDAPSSQRALSAWYRARAAKEFAAMLERCHRHPRFRRYPQPALQIRAMRTRWGSLGSRRGMTLNVVLIQAPLACLEFVVMHELCHLRYHGHGKGFYRLLEAVLPDWRARKRTLEDLLR